MNIEPTAQEAYYDGVDLDEMVTIGGSDLDSQPLDDKNTARLLASRKFQTKRLPKPIKTPEYRAQKFGYSHAECRTVGRWLGLLLEQCPKQTDALEFWRAAQVIKWISEPEETQAV